MVYLKNCIVTKSTGSEVDDGKSSEFGRFSQQVDRNLQLLREREQLRVGHGLEQIQQILKRL